MKGYRVRARRSRGRAGREDGEPTDDSEATEGGSRTRAFHFLTEAYPALAK